MLHSIPYNHIGVSYNTTRKADPYLTDRLYQLLKPQIDGEYLDIGCGSGNYTLALKVRGLQFTGVDPSELMLSLARYQSAIINWVNSSVENLPFADSIFDGAIATLTLHHWQNLEHGFAELSRVLNHGSRLVIFTSTPEQMQGYWLNYYFPQMLSKSISVMPTMSKINEAAEKTGFIVTLQEKYFVLPDLQDLFLYSGKHKPELYFSDAVRDGISSFSLISDQEEVMQGLTLLKNDIDNGKFAAVKASFENDLGDYVFVVLEKVANPRT